MSPSLTLPDLTGSFVDEGYLQLLELIGCGSFARVYKASDTTSDPDSPAFYAVKCMKKWEAGTRHAFMVDNEIALHQQVSDNAGVVTLHRTFSDADYIYLVLDLSMEGDLLSAIIKRNPYVSPGLIQQMFVQLLDTVEYCHQQGVYHRDLKPQNILCDLQAASVKLADFGLATSGEESANFRCGSLSYMSPECLEQSSGDTYSPRQSDTWALAVILVNLTCATFPWLSAELGDPKYAEFRSRGVFMRDSFSATPEVEHFFRWCFHVDPTRRPTIPQMREAILNVDVLSLPVFPIRPPRFGPPCSIDVAFSDRALVMHLSPSQNLWASPEPSEFPHSAILDASLYSSVLSCPSSLSISLTPDTSASDTSARPSTPIAQHTSDPQIELVPDLLDSDNVGLSAAFPVLTPIKMTSARSPPAIIYNMHERRYTDDGRTSIATRRRFNGMFKGRINRY